MAHYIFSRAKLRMMMMMMRTMFSSRNVLLAGKKNLAHLKWEAALARLCTLHTLLLSFCRPLHIDAFTQNHARYHSIFYRKSKYEETGFYWSYMQNKIIIWNSYNVKKIIADKIL